MSYGYAHPAYARSLAEFGAVRELPRCQGHVLVREIPGFRCHDAMGCYPLFMCQNWRELDRDLDEMGNDLVCLNIVTDPFGAVDEPYLRRCFNRIVLPFKEHFLCDLSRPAAEFVSKHHQYYARRAARDVEIEVVEEPIGFADEWTALYGVLAERFQLKGIKAFSARAFAAQLKVPGIVAMRARSNGETVAGHLWYVNGDVAYSHLATSTARGYELSAAYAMYWFALEFFQDKVRWLNLGAGAGTNADSSGGLTFFKQGWSSGTKTSYFCARLFDESQYQNILATTGTIENAYFPAYRHGELA
jgi:GNAT acetyltransferase-like protein